MIKKKESGKTATSKKVPKLNEDMMQVLAKQLMQSLGKRKAEEVTVKSPDKAKKKLEENEKSGSKKDNFVEE